MASMHKKLICDFKSQINLCIEVIFKITDLVIKWMMTVTTLDWTKSCLPFG